ncbi:membrane protein insertase YidC [uncultured Litoreibacter sp.]|uniref:membrane protein insertase YidC n=1 Tax=uncultured Litoreibacter sp. TaxID=1392394 RepID=UPI00261915AF|nr:membrane protein insertase YidC [uncultured Litoreibacter sp.]
MDDQNKNLILATALSFLVILGWFFFFPPEEPIVDPNATPTAVVQEDGSAALPPATGSVPTAPAAATVAQTRETALAENTRLKIETPSLTGSISLTGGRLDDLALSSYRETLDDASDNVTLLSPVGTDNAYYALYGWAPSGSLTYEQVPGANTQWSLTQGENLAPNSPVTLTWDNGAGLVFHRIFSVDENFMFTVTQKVENTTGAAQRIQPYGIVARHGEPEIEGFFIAHEGVVVMADGVLDEIDYDDMPELPTVAREAANASVVEVGEKGWVGFADKYWMTTLIPDSSKPFTSVVKYVPSHDIYQTETRLQPVDIAAGETAEVTTRLFAGAKEWDAIKEYEAAGVYNFIDSIDWGWFFFLTKPIFAVLHWLNTLIGNMGWSIIALTLLIKALLFPLAYKSYVSMAKMKELQPQMEKIKEKAGDDRQKLQQAMMDLYKKEKVNPAAGCLPILLQIPIFFSLYKVIFNTIELRHAPWVGWIRDLSAPDPSSILNLFGALPYATPEPGSLFFILSLGVLPIILGISMWLQQKLNPAPTDATQAMIFAWMPWVFMFMLGSFASGLVIYWIANNVITFIQQYSIMRSQGYKPDIFGNIKAGFKRNKAIEGDKK